MQILLLDSNSLLNRAYYALPNLTDRTGMHTGAIFGYMNMLINVINKYKPTHAVAVFDRKAPVFRKAIYEGYKAQRKPMPEELAEQLEPLKDILRAMRIPVAEMDGFEADDIIGSISKQWEYPAFIVTGDRDSLQLVSDRVHVLLTKKGVSEVEDYSPERLKEDGLTPSQVIDLKALMGDASDNIPGVPGVGEKTAKALLEKYSTLDGVYGHVEEEKGKLKEKLIEGRESAYMSYTLATIKCDIELPLSLEEAELKMPFSPKVREELLKYGLIKVADRLDISAKEEKPREYGYEVEILNSERALDAYIEKIKAAGHMSISLEGGLFLATDERHGARTETAQTLFEEGLEYSRALQLLKDVLQDECIKKTVYDQKTLMHTLEGHGITLRGVSDDALLLAWLDDANRTYKTQADAFTSFGIDPSAPACAVYLLKDTAERGVKDKGMYKIYTDIELPLVPVLFDMEKAGFRVDKQGLTELNAEFDRILDDLTQKVYALAGEEFNINSPRQLAHILFEKLGLKSGKKNKTGLSTNVEVLTDLEDEHPVVPLVLRYREIAKLRSTYVFGMLPLVDENDKLHTVFKQTATSTGRLSSTEPNLQNIPVRKAEGALIRKLFIASPGNVLITADYSQIELRLMAHFSGDAAMCAAFNAGRDIHTATAAKVFRVPEDMVTPQMRRHAKAVNFGIIYGISEYGLAKDLGIPRARAREFMQGYFHTYPQVKEYMEKAIELAKQNGYVQTLFGRRREVPELKAANHAQRGFGERVALNMPLQGTASDIIKIAMIKVARKMKECGCHSRLIMQVHDELIIDAVPEEVEKMQDLLRECMENVIQLKVRLEVSVNTGSNWLEAK